MGSGQQDADGWTILQPSPESIVMHVSNSGSDTNDGLTPETAKQTVKAAIAALGKRKGNPDWIRLERGSVFAEGRIGFSLSGRSQKEPVVLTSYGTGAGPVLKDSELFYWWLNGSPDNSMDHVVISGIDFEGTGVSKGILFSGRMSDIMIEDCRFRGVRVGVNLQYQPTHPKSPGTVFPRIQNIRIRRNSFIGCPGLCGVEIDGTDGCTIEQNLFDRCGQPNPSVKKHNCYLFEVTDLAVSSNYFLRGSNMGLKCSSDTIDGFTRFRIDSNYFFNNALSMDHSAGITHDPKLAYSHTNGIVSHNLFHESAREFATGKQDLAMWLLNISDVTIRQNYFIHKQLWSGNRMLMFEEPANSVTVRENIVHNWQMPAGRPETDYLEGKWSENITNGVSDGNIIVKDAAAYIDPNRTLLTWLQVPDMDAASAVLRESHTRDKWDAGKTADKAVGHVIDGFRIAIPDIEPEPVPDTVIAVRESDLSNLIIAVEGVLTVLKRIAGRN